jgi:hypothetical protein
MHGIESGVEDDAENIDEQLVSRKVLLITYLLNSK